MTGRRRTGRNNSRRRWTVTDASPSISPALRIKRKDRGTGSQSGSQTAQPTCTTTDAHGAQTAALSVKADPLDQSGRLVETYGSVSVVAVLLGGGPPGSASVTRCDSLRIRPLRRALLLTSPSGLPTPAC